jgi:hypothetical protein
VIKTSKIRRRPVHLHTARPSRIRRDPAVVNKAEDLRRNAWWESREWEIRLAVIGITFFTLAISAMVIDLGEVLGH